MLNKYLSLIYPHGKVHPKYIKYIGWSFVSNILVSTESAISTHSMLHAITTNEIASSVNYIGKDVIGQIGSIIYILNNSKNVDNNPKKFLFYSNILQQTSYFMMCSTPLFSSYFLPIAGLSNILSNISFISYGAINAKCINKISIDKNLGEIYAKISIINSVGSSIGLICGLYITMLVPDHDTRLLFIPFLAIARIYTFNLAIESIL